MKASVTAENKAGFGMTGETYGKDQTMCELNTTTDTVTESPSRCACCGEEVKDGTGPRELLHPKNHKQVTIKVCGLKLKVDKKIAPLIKELWRCGICTAMSCQEGAHGMIWLHFLDADLAAEFLTAVADYDPDPESLYHRILGDYGLPDNWVVETRHVDVNLVENYGEGNQPEERHEGQPEFRAVTSVWFPPSDLPAVMRKLAAHPTYDWADDPTDGAVALSKDD
jgi:hypothetical protein